MDNSANVQAILVRIARGGVVLGGYYLSYVELSLKSGALFQDDWGWIESMADWKPLGELVPRLRQAQGKKQLATSSQRAYLKACGYEPWRGMSQQEAHAVLNAFHHAYEVPPGSWILEPISDAQVDFLRELGESFHPNWTKGQASLAISERLKQLEAPTVKGSTTVSGEVKIQ